MDGKPVSAVAELFPIESECFRSEYQEYFRGKRQNFFVSLAVYRNVWDCLQRLNDIWMRELSNVEHVSEQTHLLPKLIFSSAHGRFLTGIELGFSCSIRDSYSVLRDGIEATAHAYKIFKEPASAGVAWSEKHQGRQQKGVYNGLFEQDKKNNLFPADVPDLHQLHTYYGSFCEMATHTSVTSIGLHFEDMSVGRTLRWGFHYFEKNPQKLAGFFNVLLQVSAHMEAVLYGCFESRLSLDPELGRMRAEFQIMKQLETSRLMAIYNEPQP